MKFVYFGSFHISADILAGMVERGAVPMAVVCNPDRPAGRNKIITPPAVKQLILEKKWPIKILQPEKVKDIATELKDLGTDVFLVMGYPQIIPESILNIPRLRTIGVHPSLLPTYRGPSPIQSVLLAGEHETGVTLYMIDKDVDHGKIISNVKFQISNEETNTSLEKRVAEVAADLIADTLPNIETITLCEQDHAAATFTQKFTSADGRVDFIKDEPLEVYRKIKAFNPEPGVWTINFPGHEGKRVKLLAAQWRDNKIHITSIHVEGKRPIKIG